VSVVSKSAPRAGIALVPIEEGRIARMRKSQTLIWMTSACRSWSSICDAFLDIT
jgi:hypothetical protein